MTRGSARELRALSTSPQRRSPRRRLTMWPRAQLGETVLQEQLPSSRTLTARRQLPSFRRGALARAESDKHEVCASRRRRERDKHAFFALERRSPEGNLGVLPRLKRFGRSVTKGLGCDIHEGPLSMISSYGAKTHTFE